MPPVLWPGWPLLVRAARSAGCLACCRWFSTYCLMIDIGALPHEAVTYDATGVRGGFAPRYRCRRRRLETPLRLFTTVDTAACGESSTSRVTVIIVQARYRYRIEPTEGQRLTLTRTFGCARVVFNDAIRCREGAKRAGEKVSPSEVQLAKRRAGRSVVRSSNLAKTIGSRSGSPVTGSACTRTGSSTFPRWGTASGSQAAQTRAAGTGESPAGQGKPEPGAWRIRTSPGW
jgi:hypothetical protein